jgi:hypothetical protein
MLGVTVFWLVCFGAGPRQSPGDPPRPFDIDAMSREELARAQRGRGHLEEEVRILERELNESPPRYTPAEAARVRRYVETFRVAARFMGEIEDELKRYALQRTLDPSPQAAVAHGERLMRIADEWAACEKGTIAPMPREKK